MLKVAAICRALSISIDELVRDAERDRPPLEATIMTHGIVSAGYEGRTIGGFLSELQRMGVQTVADVRLNAISRKAGFSKTRLRDELATAGIRYVHLPSLGNAKENRRPFWEGRAEEGRRAYRQALQSPQAESALQELTALARHQVIAILCFEDDVEKCHRKVLIDQIADATGAPVVYLAT